MICAPFYLGLHLRWGDKKWEDVSFRPLSAYVDEFYKSKYNELIKDVWKVKKQWAEWKDRGEQSVGSGDDDTDSDSSEKSKKDKEKEKDSNWNWGGLLDGVLARWFAGIDSYTQHHSMKEVRMKAKDMKDGIEKERVQEKYKLGKVLKDISGVSDIGQCDGPQQIMEKL